MFNPFKLAQENERLKGQIEYALSRASVRAAELAGCEKEIENLTRGAEENGKEIRRLDRALTQERERNEKLASAQHNMHAVQAWLRGIEEERASEPQIVGTLAATTADNPLWRALHTLLARQTELERDYALRPGLTDDDRQYYAGRAAGLLEFQAGLTAKHLQCQKTNE